MSFRFSQSLYPIADASACRDVLTLTEAILAGGALLVQLRAKDLHSGDLVRLARKVLECTTRAGAQLIINDRVDVAKLIGATGVHLGQEDLPPAAARDILGPRAVIGFSTHNLAQVDAAIAAGAIDYLAYGPIFATTNKRNPDPLQGVAAVRDVRARCPLPLVAIGGITAKTLDEVLNAGADAVAVIGAIAHAPDPAAATRALLKKSESVYPRNPL
jgi:thiamine-phosphate pyrophosphorylase